MQVCVCVCECFTLIKLFLNVVLVRLVPADAIQAFCRQTCKHKQETTSVTALTSFAQPEFKKCYARNVSQSAEWKSSANRSSVIGFI